MKNEKHTTFIASVGIVISSVALLGVFAAARALNVSMWVANALYFAVSATATAATAATAASAVLSFGIGFALAGTIAYYRKRMSRSQFVAW